jgi:hypothetical protein
MALNRRRRVQSAPFIYLEVDTVKNRLFAVLAAAVLTVPAVASAQQNNGGLTRAQVRAELVQLENAGYNPHRITVKYPAEIEAAEAKVRSSDSMKK